jgi:uncharacterized membrane protein HdeD (DUF308 family)
MIRRRHAIGPPARATWVDFYRIGLGALMIPLGITILVRAANQSGLTPPALLMGIAFIGFGVYRLYLGFVRYRMYREMRRK